MLLHELSTKLHYSVKKKWLLIILRSLSANRLKTLLNGMHCVHLVVLIQLDVVSRDRLKNINVFLINKAKSGSTLDKIIGFP